METFDKGTFVSAPEQAQLDTSSRTHASTSRHPFTSNPRFQMMSGQKRSQDEADLELGDEEEDDDEEEEVVSGGGGSGRLKQSNKRNATSTGRRKIDIQYIDDKSKRHVSFTKRKAGLMKKAFELSTLTGTECLILVISETGLAYTYATPGLKPVVETGKGREIVWSSLRGELADDDEDDDNSSTNNAVNKNQHLAAGSNESEKDHKKIRHAELHRENGGGGEQGSNSLVRPFEDFSDEKVYPQQAFQALPRTQQPKDGGLSTSASTSAASASTSYSSKPHQSILAASLPTLPYPNMSAIPYGTSHFGLQHSVANQRTETQNTSDHAQPGYKSFPSNGPPPPPTHNHPTQYFNASPSQTHPAQEVFETPYERAAVAHAQAFANYRKRSGEFGQSDSSLRSPAAVSSRSVQSSQGSDYASSTATGSATAPYAKVLSPTTSNATPPVSISFPSTSVTPKGMMGLTLGSIGKGPSTSTSQHGAHEFGDVARAWKLPSGVGLMGYQPPSTTTTDVRGVLDHSGHSGDRIGVSRGKVGRPREAESHEEAALRKIIKEDAKMALSEAKKSKRLSTAMKAHVLALQAQRRLSMDNENGAVSSIRSSIQPYEKTPLKGLEQGSALEFYRLASEKKGIETVDLLSIKLEDFLDDFYGLPASPSHSVDPAPSKTEAKSSLTRFFDFLVLHDLISPKAHEMLTTFKDPYQVTAISPTPVGFSHLMSMGSTPSNSATGGRETNHTSEDGTRDSDRNGVASDAESRVRSGKVLEALSQYCARSFRKYEGKLDPKGHINGIFEVYLIRPSFVLVKEDTPYEYSKSKTSRSPYKVKLPRSIIKLLRVGDQYQGTMTLKAGFSSSYVLTSIHLVSATSSEAETKETDIDPQSYRTNFERLLGLPDPLSEETERGIVWNRHMYEVTTRARVLLEEQDSGSERE